MVIEELQENAFLNSTFNFFSNLTIKNEKEADKYETKQSLLEADIYIGAILDLNSFVSFDYSVSDISKVLKVTIDKAEDIKRNKYISLSEKQKEELFTYKSKSIKQEYVEKNNYYRALNGLPPYGEKAICLSNGIPVSDLTDEEIALTYREDIDNLIIKNPSLLYLKYLGYNRIDVVLARMSKNFAILSYPKTIFTEIQNKQIMDYYYENLGYVTSVLYSKAYENKNNYYDNFMILFLVFNTMQRFITSKISGGISRDFYDQISLKNMFESFGVPYWDKLPIKYQRRIVKNINQLLAKKGTDKVLVDIVNLFGFENVEIFKYYLVKEENNNGKEDLVFVGAPIESTNKVNAVQNSSYREGYWNFTNPDPYWGGTERAEMYNKILEKEFNIINTKYISINTMYSVTQLSQETAYFFNLVNKMQEENMLDKLTFINSDIKPDGNPIRFFDAIVALNILICKKLNVKDKIISSSTGVASVYGFNFDNDIEVLKDFLSEKQLYNKDNPLVKQLSLPAGFASKEELVNIFFKNKNYKQEIEKGLLTTQDIRVYRTLKQIRQFNLEAEWISGIYDDSTTYSEYLDKEDSILYNYIEASFKTPDMINETLNVLLNALQTYIDSDVFKYVFLGLSDTASSILKEYLKTLIIFFKAYTVDLKSINTYYIFDDKFMNTIKLIEDISETVTDFNLIDSILELLIEDVTIEKCPELLDKIMDNIEECYKLIKIMDMEDIINITDEIIKCVVTGSYNEFMLIVDEAIINKNKDNKDNIFILEEYKKQIEYNLDIIIKHTEEFLFKAKEIRISNLNIVDSTNINKDLLLKDNIEIIDIYDISRNKTTN